MLIPVILGVSLLVYVMMDLAPGNMIDMISGDMTEQEVAKLYHEYGYDRSVFYRYFHYMKGLFQGDLGYSPVYRQEVWKLYMQRLRFAAYLNDVATFSSIKVERGTSYPFARTLSFSLTATF